MVVELVDSDGEQIIRLPPAFRLPGSRVEVRRQGQEVILAPLKPATWPPGFFESIRISDPAFVRPEQGVTPPSPTLD
jgi:virulence-associated protein VagC